MSTSSRTVRMMQARYNRVLGRLGARRPQQRAQATSRPAGGWVGMEALEPRVMLSAATQVVFLQQPMGTTAGNVLSPAVTVEVEDALGNVVTTDSSNVTLAIASGPTGATLGGTATVAANDGVATFTNLSLTTTGNYTLEASDAALTPDTSNSFQVTPGAAAKLGYVQAPVATAVGATVYPAISVAVEDSFGNVVTTDSSSVTLSIASGPTGGALNGTLTVPAVSGVATFNQLYLSQVGPYTLKAADGALTPVTSGSFNVLPYGVQTQATFNGTTSGIFPSSLLADTHGNIFGVTQEGGANGEGSVFELASGSNTISTLASFNFTNGDDPTSLVIDGNGNLFGTTEQGGTNSDGVVFEIAAGTGTITPLASFAGTNGSFPVSVVLDPNGNLFGTTGGGGADSDGTVFEIAKGTGTITTVASFNGTNSSVPDLVLVDSQDNLTGITGGSLANYGSIFTIAAGSRTITTLASFNYNNGDFPNSLLTDAQGDLFGTTLYGGASGAGSVFELPNGSGTITTLASFDAGTLGASPAGLLMDSRGNLFGTAQSAGANEDGTAFEIAAGTNTLTVLAAFDGTNGSTPNSLIFDSQGALVGTTGSGGTAGDGTVFELAPPSAGLSAELAFVQQPGNTTPNTTLSPALTVAVEDAYGNVVTTDNSTVTLTIASGPTGGTLGGTVTAAAVDGVATFNSLSLGTAGTYTLGASDGTLIPATSTSFSVSAPLAGVTGDGQAVADGESSPSTANATSFGSVVQGAASVVETYTITNSGTATLTIGPGDVTVPAGFTVTQPLLTSLAPTASTTFTVTLPTTATGTFSGNVAIPTNDPNNNPYLFAITGTVTTPAPTAGVTGNANAIADGESSPSTTNATSFGSVVQGAASVVETYTITNSGTATLTIGPGDVTVPAGFTVTQPLSTSLAPTASTTFTVTLPTTATGTFSGNVSIPTNDTNNNPYLFAITGTVTTPAPTASVTGNSQAIADGESSPSTANATSFGSVVQGAASVVETYTITNSGTATLTIGPGDVTVPAGFTVTQPLSTSLAPTASTTFTVTLPTTATGAFSGNVSIPTNDANNNPYLFAITGTVNTTAPTAAVTGNANAIADGESSPSTTNDTSFGAVVQGAASVVETYTITNSGTATLTIGPGSVTAPAGFTVTQPLSTSLAPTASTTFTVTLPTTATGTFSGNVSIPTNDANNNPYLFAITGTVNATAPAASVTGNSQAIADGSTTPSTTNDTDFGSVVLGGTPVDEVYTIANSGTAALTIGTVTVPTGFVLAAAPTSSVAAGSSTTFTVELPTTSEGTFAGNVSFTTNDSNNNPYTFAITGTVTAPSVSVTGNSQPITNGSTIPSTANDTDFGAVALGATATETYTIDNTGNAALTVGTVTVPTGFTLVTPPGTSIAAGDTTTFTVGLNTTGGGTFAGNVSFSTNDPNNPSYTFAISGAVTGPAVSVTGNSHAIADGSTTPSTINDTDFGSVAQGATATETYTIANTGNAALTVGAVSVPTGFTLVTPPSASVAAGATTQFTVGLVTTNVGTFSGNVGFTTNDPNNPDFTFAITGTVTGPAVAVTGNSQAIANGSTTPSTTNDTDFGTVLQGATANETYTIDNTGSTALTVGTVTVPTGFTLVTAPGTSVAAGDSTTFTVGLDTSTLGTVSGNVSFTTNDPNNLTYTFAITGTVTSVPVASVSVTGNSQPITNGSATPSTTNDTDFGSVAQGATATETYTIDNTGSAALTVGTVTVPTGFTLVTAPGTSVAAGDSTTFTVGLDTSTLGTASGNVSFTTNDPNNLTYTFAITGTVTAVTEPSVGVTGNSQPIANGSTTPSTTNDTDFGSVAVGATATETYTIANSGTAALTVGTVTVPTGFTLVTAPGTSVAAGDSTTFTVGLDTSTLGTASGNVSFTTNDPNNLTYTFAVTGTVTNAVAGISVTGNAQPIANGSTTPSAANDTAFGSVLQGGTAAETYTITDTGNAALTIGTVTLPTGFTLVSAPAASVNAGASTTLIVGLDTSAVGTASGNISLTTSDPNNPTYTFAVSGTVASSADAELSGTLSVEGIDAAGTVVSDGVGDITGGSLQLSQGPVAAITGTSYTVSGVGAVTVDATGTTTPGSLPFNYTADGTIDATHDLTVVTLANASTSSDTSLGVVVSPLSATFADSDAAGTWDFTTANLHGSITLNSAGGVTGKIDTAAKPKGLAVTGTYTISASGAESVTLDFPADSGQSDVTFTGQMDASKDVVALDDSTLGQANSTNAGMAMMIRPSAAKSVAGDGAGTWTFDGNLFAGTLTLNGKGKVTSGSVTPADSSTAEPVTGTYKIASTGAMTLTLKLGTGKSATKLTLTGALNASDDVAAFDNSTLNKGTPNIVVLVAPASNVATIGTLTSNSPVIVDSTLTLTANDVTIPSPGTIKKVTFYIAPAGATTYAKTDKAVGVGKLISAGTYALNLKISKKMAAGTYTYFAIAQDSFARLSAPVSTSVTITTTAAHAGVSVTGAAQAIANGESTPTTTNDTDFGSVAQGATANETYTIANSGNAALTLGTVTVPTGFTLVTAPAASVAIGGATTFTVGLITTTAGTFNGNVSFTTNDPSNPTFTFAVTGTVSSVTTPTITPSTTTLNLPTTTQGTAGATTSFTVSGSDLTDSTSVVLTAPTGSELSLNGTTGFAPSLTLNADATGALASTTVFVRIAASATANVSGNLTVVDAADTLTQNIAVTGTVSSVTTPTITPSTTTLNLPTTTQGTAGATTSFTVSGSDLTDSTSVVLTAPTGSEISLNNTTGFGPSLTLNADATGVLASTTVFARIAASATANVSGNLTVVDTADSVTQNIAVTGTATTPTTPTITPSTTTLNLPTTTQGTAGATVTFSVSGSDLTDSTSVVLTAPTGSEISLNNTTGFGPSLTLNADATGVLASTTVFARIAASATANVSGNLTVVDTADSVTQNIAVTGTANAPAVATAELQVVAPAAAAATGPAEVGSVTAGASTINRLDAVTLTASDVSGTASKVQFWLAPAGAASLDDIGDTLLGTGTLSGDAWALELQSLSTVAPGDYVVFARAMGPSGAWGAATPDAVTLV